METLKSILKGRNLGKALNDKGETCDVYYTYIVDVKHFSISFEELKLRSFGGRQVYQIRSLSEKKIEKFLNENNFKPL